MPGKVGTRDASEWLFRLRSRMPVELSPGLNPASRHAYLNLSMVAYPDSVSLSVTKVALPSKVLLMLMLRVQLGPEQPWNGQSGEPQGT